jgi:hypothetical protein
MSSSAVSAVPGALLRSLLLETEQQGLSRSTCTEPAMYCLYLASLRVVAFQSFAYNDSCCGTTTKLHSTVVTHAAGLGQVTKLS